MNSQDLIFASLMGVNNFKTFERLKIVENDLSKKVFPSIPFLPFQNEDRIVQQTYESELKQNKYFNEIPPDQQFFKCGFSFRNSDTVWYFPYEPLITVSGGWVNNRANVSKKPAIEMPNFETSPTLNPKRLKFNDVSGTMVTTRRMKDFEISITGIFFGKQENGTPEQCYPIDQITQLLDFLTEVNEIRIYHEQLLTLGITNIVIEDYSFPFTKGENTQAFEIRAISDFKHDLIVKD